MPLLKSIKTLLGFVLLGIAGAWMGCSDSAPVASRPAGKATCALCEFLGDETYTAADGLAAPASTDTTQTQAEADSTQADADADADSTQSAAIEFADANLEAAVREALDRPSGPLTAADLATLTVLNANGRGIQSLAGLEHATALQELALRRNEITDVSPLASLTNLQRLSLWGNEVEDVSPLASLTNLQRLSLWGNAITDVSPLASLTNLQWLQLGDNAIADISPLASLTNLKWLSVVDNALTQHAAEQQLAALIASGLSVQAQIERYPRVEPFPEPEPEPEIVAFIDANLEAAMRTALNRPDGDLVPADLASLTIFNAANRNIRRLNGLEHATNLQTLYLNTNAIADVSPLASLTNLRVLRLWGNAIRRVQPLASLTNLRELELGDNMIANVQPLASLTNLGLLNLHTNAIADVSQLPWASLPLFYLDLRNNMIVDVQPLLPLRPPPGLGLGVLLTNNPLSQASRTRLTAMNQINGISVAF